MRKYFVVDFHGYIRWTMLDDYSFAVDPLYLDDFKTIFHDVVEVVA